MLRAAGVTELRMSFLGFTRKFVANFEKERPLGILGSLLRHYNTRTENTYWKYGCGVLLYAAVLQAPRKARRF